MNCRAIEANMIDRDTTIQMAREAGFLTGSMDCADGKGAYQFIKPIGDSCIVEIEKLVKAAYAAGQAAESKRADALAATLIALRDIVTTEAESKEAFVSRVRAVLGACPDARLLEAVKAEREACEKAVRIALELHSDPLAAIRARAQQ